MSLTTMAIAQRKQELMVSHYCPKPRFCTSHTYIDEPTTDHSTILTAMEDAEQITQAAGQKYTIFTADQQLYAIVLNIISCNPEMEILHTKTGRNALANEFHMCMRLSDERKWTTSIIFKCICRCQQNAGWGKVPYEYEGT